MRSLALKPRVSEKAYALSESGNTYVFDVETSVNKFDVGRAVAGQYEVTVLKVRLVTIPGKATRSYRQRGRKSLNGQRSDIKKAYVTLKEGDKLPFLAGGEEPEPPKGAK